MFGKLFGKSSKKALLTVPDFAEGDVDGFWRWFAENVGTLRRFIDLSSNEPVPEPVLREVGAALTKVHEDLTYEIGIEPGGKLDLVISAGGIHSVFPSVTALHAAAPRSDEFRATAFRQRTEGVIIRMKDREVSAETTAYVSQVDGSKLDVWLYLPLPDDASHDDLKEIGFIILDATLGEYDVATCLDGISFHRMSEAPESARPLTELVAEVDAISQRQTQ